MMKEIYSRAGVVWVWLDVDLHPDAPSVQRLLNLHDGMDDLGEDSSFWKPVIPLLRNKYWDRLWIQQELVFAPKLEFVCHGVVVPGHKL